MSNILDKIVTKTKEKVAQRKAKISIKKLELSKNYKKKRYSLCSVLLTRQTNIIAEIKFCSPSQGNIHFNIEPEKIAKDYQQAGAVALSVLTEEDYFSGKMQHLSLARENTNIPILRKDFMIDEYQIVEARAIGADAILLIAASLSKEQIIKFTNLAHELELEVLLEVHSLEELENVFYDKVDILGVNNRNLKNLQVSLDTSLEIAGKIPKTHCKISESGISKPEHIHTLKLAGYNGFLMGEIFMKTKHPAQSLQGFLKSL